eukprot:9445045-Pyramimonas_sp.AAC.1
MRRAPRQRVRFVERRGAKLRHIHAAEEQLEREDTTSTFDIMFARAIFGGGGLARVGGVTSCNVVFGRQPPILPLLEADEE